MKPFIQVALATGHVYEIDTQRIAKDAIDRMLAELPEMTQEEARAQVEARFADIAEIQAHALVCLDHDELLSTAKLIRFTPPPMSLSDDATGWSAHEAPAIMGELEGADIMRLPVEAVLTTMAASLQSANVTVLQQGPNVFGAVAVFLGNENTIAQYIQAIQFTTNLLTNPAQPPEVVPHPTN